MPEAKAAAKKAAAEKPAEKKAAAKKPAKSAHRAAGTAYLVRLIPSAPKYTAMV